MDSPQSNMPKEKETITVEDLCLLANSFAEQAQYDKAIQLYESACRLFPENLALKINLGRIRNLRNQALNSPSDILPKGQEPSSSVLPLPERFQGLAEVFLKNGRIEEARQVFEISKSHARKSYLAHLNLGRLCMQTKEFSRAAGELEQAHRLNPFDETILDLRSLCHFELREYETALQCAVDALILSGEISKRKPEKYRERIRLVMSKIPLFTTRMRNDLIRERRNRINALFQELEIELEKLKNSHVSSESSISDTDSSDKAAAPAEKQEIVSLMKHHLIFRNMSEEDVCKAAQFTSQIQVLQTDFVYHEGEPIYGLYFISRGRVEIQKSTPYGPIVLCSFEQGSFFGDDNLLSGRERYTGALVVQDCDLLFMDKTGLANIFARQRALAIHFLWYFWKSLSFQVRQSNDRMTSFFAGSTYPPRADHGPDKKSAAPVTPPSHVEIDKKLVVLQAKGLSVQELGHIARLSNEEVFNQGETIFREGDVGDRLYILLEGSVLISKAICGVGKETLAVLKKGDFFGEMALVGQYHRRSADAQAQSQGTTLLVISREALREILSVDTNAAYQFLTILCRILSQRLLEINEKIYQWRMMAGSFS